MKIPQYPIFITAKDDPQVELLMDERELRNYDDIDVEEGLFFGWDINGFPLELYIEKCVVRIRCLSTESQINKLKEAILNYANQSRPDSPFMYSGPEDNIIELFKEVEKHIKERSFRQKVKRFLNCKSKHLI